MKERLIERMEEPKHGKTYVRRTGGAAHTHVASAPGEAPASDTDRLIESFQVTPVDASTLSVASNDPKAIHLETGGRHMAARPNFLHVASELRDETAEIIAEEIRAVIK
jgi:hypothetical protein